jgi:transposase
MKDSKMLVGRKVFVGIDVHARSYKVGLVADGERVCVFSCPADSDCLVEKLLKLTDGALSVSSVYEAGFSGFVLHRKLVSSGINNIVVNPSSLEVAANDMVKTDRKDALKLAMHLSQGRLRGIHIPSEEQERERLFHRKREQFIKDRTSLKNRIRMELRQFGLLGHDYTQKLTLSKVEEVLQEAHPEIVEVVSIELKQWRELDCRIAELESKLRIQAERSSIDTILRAIPGIGFITARTLASELGNFRQFKNERQLGSFAGMTPCEFSSGEKIRKGRISRQGSSRLRRVLVEAAWSAIGKDASFRAFYDRLKMRSGSRRAIVAVARKILLLARRMVLTGEVYQPPLQATAG